MTNEWKWANHPTPSVLQARAKQTPKGKLGRELERQRAQTRSESLNEAAREERRRREVEEGEERRVFN